MNLVEYLLQDDALLGQHLDEDGLGKLRAGIIKQRGGQELPTQPNANPGPYGDSGFSSGVDDYTPRRHTGELLTENEDGTFGLREAPMSL